MGNIRSGSRARSASKIPENLTQTNSLISDQAANLAEYEKYVIQQNAEATKARAVSFYFSHSFSFFLNNFNVAFVWTRGLGEHQI